ncbi:MAG: hypothetical protein JWQ39_81 [Glaciihabitans sp.]|jgi:hypothetical protein|nr:hypothetical protein [Glaciihabitans sp.]
MNVFGFIIAFVIFVAGLVLFGFAFTVPSFEAVMFVGGIILVSISLAIPFHILGHGEQR